MKKLAIYAIHPIMYQTPIFRCLQKHIEQLQLPLLSEVIFGDDLSLKPIFFKETAVTFQPDTPDLLKGYSYRFLKNYAQDARSGFWSRINWGVFSLFWREKYDVVLIHGYESLTAWLMLFAAKLSGSKILWRGESVLKGNEQQLAAKTLLKKIILNWFFARCDHLLYSCTGNQRYLEFYGVAKNKLSAIPCSVDNVFFQQQYQQLLPSRREKRQVLGIQDQDLVLLFCARFTQRKCPYDLIKAVQSIPHQNIVILWVGDGPEKTSMQQAVDVAGIRSVFTGFKNQSEISEYYLIADVDIVISSYDPSPKALNEAMNFRLPIMVTDVVGTAEDLVTPGVNGYVVKVGDVAQMAEHLAYLDQHRDEVKRMGDESLRVVNQWNYDADVAGILQAVNAVTEKSL